METIRTFVSLNPEGKIKKILGKVQQELKESLAGFRIKWEDPAKFHLTLRFLGDLNRGEVKELSAELEKLRFDFDSLTFRTKGIGFFPNPKFPNVIFADLSEDGSDSAILVSAIDKVIDMFGIKPDKQFVPHITLGRFKRDGRQRLEMEPTVKVPAAESVFTAFYFMKSTLKTGGSVYEEIKKFNFKQE